MLPSGDGTVPRRRGLLERGDAAVHYEVVGSGLPVVFAHGLGGSHLSWWQQVPAFMDRFTCITFAHRGFHPSRGVPDPDEYAGDLLALLDELALPRAVVVAQSMGGWTALEAALRAPERIAAILMSATSGRIDPRSAADLSTWEQRASRAAPDFMQRGIHPAMGARAAREQPALHLLYRQVDESANVADKDALRQRLMGARTRAPDVLDGLRMPVLWVAGEEDAVFPPEVAVALARRMGSTARILPRTGHSPYFERAAEFNAILGEFLAGL